MSTNYLQMLKKVDKMPIYMDVESLDMYCEYLLNDNNKSITYSNLSNLSDFINAMDPKVIMTSDAKMARYQFIQYYLEARLTKGIMKRDLAISYVMDQADPKYAKIIRREIINSIDPDQLGKKDIEFINSMIFAQLNTVFMHRYQIGLTKLIEDINNNDFGKSPENCVDAIQFFQTILSDLTKSERRSKQENRFNLTDKEHFKAMLTEAATRILSKSTFLNTGIQGLNQMLNGGFENARVYNFIGATGGFKSGLLLNLMKNIKVRNKGREHKDPTKRPTILFLSQENNIWETIERLYGIFGDNVKKIRDCTAEEILETLNGGGLSVVTDEEDIDIEFRYYGNMDIGVADIRGIVEELDNEGREVICVIQDYIERLRPPMISADKRVQLIDVSNQMHDLAIELDIPIVTASQYNRGGVSTIESARDGNKLDAGRMVGMKDISESFGMLKNFDANIGIVIEEDPTEERFYLSFRTLKYRGDDSGALKYFLQPFVGTKSKIKLVDDIDWDKAAYRESMTDENVAEYVEVKEQIQANLQQTATLMNNTVDVSNSDIDMSNVAQMLVDEERAAMRARCAAIYEAKQNDPRLKNAIRLRYKPDQSHGKYYAKHFVDVITFVRDRESKETVSKLDGMYR